MYILFSFAYGFSPYIFLKQKSFKQKIMNTSKKIDYTFDPIPSQLRKDVINSVITDKAFIIYNYLLSVKDLPDFKISAKRLATMFISTEHTIGKHLRSLEKAGWLTRSKLKQGTKFTGTQYTIHTKKVSQIEEKGLSQNTDDKVSKIIDYYERSKKSLDTLLVDWENKIVKDSDNLFYAIVGDLIVNRGQEQARGWKISDKDREALDSVDFSPHNEDFLEVIHESIDAAISSGEVRFGKIISPLLANVKTNKYIDYENKLTQNI